MWNIKDERVDVDGQVNQEMYELLSWEWTQNLFWGFLEQKKVGLEHANKKTKGGVSAGLRTTPAPPRVSKSLGLTVLQPRQKISDLAQNLEICIRIYTSFAVFFFIVHTY